MNCLNAAINSGSLRRTFSVATNSPHDIPLLIFIIDCLCFILFNSQRRFKNLTFTIIGLGLGHDFFSETPISVIAGSASSQPYFHNHLLASILFYILRNIVFKFERGAVSQKALF